MRPKDIEDIQKWAVWGIWPHHNEGAQALMEFFQKETASRPPMMEPISIGMSGKHNNSIHGTDGTLDPNKKGPRYKMEGKYESFTNVQLNARQSWGVEKTDTLTREENIKKKIASFGVIQIGSYTDDFRCIALFDMPVVDTNIEQDLISKAKNKSKSLKLNYTSLNTPKAIENSFVNCIDLDLAEQYTTKGYFKFLKKLNQVSLKEFYS